MKKTLAILFAVLFAFGVFSVCAYAVNSADVIVTISDKDGKLAVAGQTVSVTDIDKDGALTVNDTLYCAHEKFYSGGAAAGYGTSKTQQWGLGLTKLWGTANGGSYGYYVNNASAWALTDTVKSGDYVCAFIYTDTDNFSDTYTYFEPDTATVKAFDSFTLTLYKLSYDSDWKLVKAPVANAFITIDGKKTPYITDENGKVTIAVGSTGNHTISADVKSGTAIVSPVCRVTASSGDVLSAVTYCFRFVIAWLTNFTKVLF